MTPERWQQIKQLLGAVLDMDPALRTAYLHESCADDVILRDEVQRLLAGDKQAGPQFLNESLLASEFAGEAPESSDHWLGRTVGHYRIVEEIGVGGMGEVFRATRSDDQYRKEVAVKVVRTEPNTDFVIARFKNERQILANLDHPNIARLLDGGTTEEGLPYVLMELVHGLPIDRYCDENKLPTTGRLKLFLQVCSAVQYAHQQLIVHRDIKPRNILVTPDGVPKLLDFGIAKILDVAAGSLDQTASMFRLLTPGYASPEQVRGESITTASDVYSLGVVLYELLTGHSPYRVANRTSHELARAVCDSEPDRPSTMVRRLQEAGANRAGKAETLENRSAVRDGSPEKLAKRLRGDLDNIVLMALRKEPQRRYASAERFAEDIRRHLANLPVAARNDTLGYRSSKFLKRHKTAVGAAVIVLLTILAGFAVTLRETRIAERRFNDVRKLANSLVFDIHDSIKDLPGSTPIRKLLVTRALEYLDRLSQEAAGDASLQSELAGAYERVGDVQGNPYYANLGDLPGALLSYRKSLAIRQRLASRNAADLSMQRELSSSYTKLGAALDGAKDFRGALAHYTEALKILERIAKDSTDPRMRDRLAGAHYYVSIASAETQDLAKALEHADQAASIRESIHSDDPATRTLVQTHLAGDYGSMAQILMTVGNVEMAVAKQRQAVTTLSSLAQGTPNDQTIKSFLAESNFYLAVALERNAHLDQALDSCHQAADIFESLLSVDPKNAFAQQYLGLTYEVQGRLEVSQRNPAVGLQTLNKAIRIFEGLRRNDPENPTTLAGFAESYMGLGRAYAALARQGGNDVKSADYLRQASAWYQKSLAVWLTLRSRNALDPLDRNKPEELSRALDDAQAHLAGLHAHANH